MAWRAITDNDIDAVLSSSELASIRAQATEGNDPIADSIRLVTDTVRGYISAHAANRLGPAGTLPERLIDAALSLFVVRVYSRTAGLLIDLNDTRKAAAESATELLRDVAAGRFAVELPAEGTTSEEDNNASAVQLVTHSARPLRRDDLAGL